MGFKCKRITNEDESENCFFTFGVQTHGEFTVHARVFLARWNPLQRRRLAGINFHNIWQVDTPREETDLASGNDHPRFVLHTSLRNKCHRSMIIITK